jgi:chromosome segregation ATPase
MKVKRRFKMDTLKLIAACVIIVGLTQLELDGGNPQRKLYAPQGKTTDPQEAARIIQEKRQAAVAAQAQSGSQPVGCASGICSMRAPAKTSEQIQQEEFQAQIEELQKQKEELQAQIEEQKQKMDEHAAKLRELQEQYDALQAFTQQTHD